MFRKSYGKASLVLFINCVTIQLIHCFQDSLSQCSNNRRKGGGPVLALLVGHHSRRMGTGKSIPDDIITYHWKADNRLTSISIWLCPEVLKA